MIQSMHANGAAFFFVAVYLHMFRGLYYGSYKAPREILWILGVVIYLLMMATAFMGYVLPWGQMSYWGAQVIISLFGAIPVVGEDITTWIRGDYLLSGITLNRFFALHVVALPNVLLAPVVLHILAIHGPHVYPGPWGWGPSSRDRRCDQRHSRRERLHDQSHNSRERLHGQSHGSQERLHDQSHRSQDCNNNNDRFISICS